MSRRSSSALWAVVFLFATYAAAWARVGESRQACAARYGEPVRTSEDGTLVTYRYRTQSVVVHFADGIADMVSHSKLPPIAGESATPFNAAQIDEILKGNAGKRAWRSEPERPYGRSWKTEDGELYALLARDGTHLMVYTAAFAAANAGSGS